MTSWHGGRTGAAQRPRRAHAGGRSVPTTLPERAQPPPPRPRHRHRLCAAQPFSGAGGGSRHSSSSGGILRATSKLSRQQWPLLEATFQPCRRHGLGAGPGTVRAVRGAAASRHSGRSHETKQGNPFARNTCLTSIKSPYVCCPNRHDLTAADGDMLHSPG